MLNKVFVTQSSTYDKTEKKSTRQSNDVIPRVTFNLSQSSQVENLDAVICLHH